MLEIQNISKNFSGLRALKDVTFTVNKGEILGLVGPNGAGKSTLINVMTGIYRPSSGKIVFMENDISKLSPNKICRLGITRTFQSVQTFPHLTAKENVMVATLFGKDGHHNVNVAEENAKRVLDFIGFPEEKHDQHIKNLNMIDLKRIQLARALATEPELLMLDEVSTGLNPKESMEAVRLIEKIRDSGITILMVEHIMRIIMGVSDRIVVLNYGEKLAEGTPKEVAENPEVIESYLGEKYEFEEGSAVA